MQTLETTSTIPLHYCVYCSKPDGSFMVTHPGGKCPYLKDYITHEMETMQLTDIYEPLDPGIAPIVELLRSHGIDTFSSCEGGEGHAFPMPTIRANPNLGMEITAHKIARILIGAGYSGFYVKQCYAYQNDPWPWEQQDQHFIEVEFWGDFAGAFLFIAIGLRAEESGDDSGNEAGQRKDE